ncbi:MAG: galactose mutarotase [Ignavibacteriae bacterium]|nr:galactose mutarotase [Ignavibacteriota bacterium]
MIKLNLFFLMFTLLTIISCSSDEKKVTQKNKTLFGKLNDGREVYLFTLKNSSGIEAKIINYGATIVSLFVPDKNGKFEDIVLGYDNLENYVNGTSYFGATVGRYGNRIGKGKFKIDENEFQLTINDGENHLHGGKIGFNKVLWKSELIQNKEGESLKLSYTSPDGEEGYPGNMNIHVTYTLTNNNELKIEYSATTDKPTISNPTHHSYFNLSGSFENTILDHKLKIDADYITPVDKGLITTGELEKVENTPMDFRKPTKIGERINNDFEQLKFGKGYDHNWAINNYDGSLKNIASLYDSTSGRFMEILSDQPGLQFYSGNFLDGTSIGKNNIKYNFRTGLCLESQVYPDSPNKKDFPNAILKPGETYKQITIYRFSIK